MAGTCRVLYAFGVRTIGSAQIRVSAHSSDVQIPHFPRARELVVYGLQQVAIWRFIFRIRFVLKRCAWGFFFSLIHFSFTFYFCFIIISFCLGILSVVSMSRLNEYIFVQCLQKNMVLRQTNIASLYTSSVTRMFISCPYFEYAFIHSFTDHHQCTIVFCCMPQALRYAHDTKYEFHSLLDSCKKK